MADAPLPPTNDDAPLPEKGPSRLRRAAQAVSRAARLPFDGLGYLYRTGQENKHFTLPVLNGAFGDQLASRHDPRAIRLSFRRHDADVSVSQLRLSAERRKTVVFLHGLMGDEYIWQTGPEPAVRYGPRLQQEVPVHCLYVRYNTGLHISENGRTLHHLLAELVAAYPEATEELVLVGHSMGGLVIRSAGHYASVSTKHEEAGSSGSNEESQPATENQELTTDNSPLTTSNWPSRLKSVFLLGVPNEGSFLEQNSHLTSTVLRKINLRPTRFISGLLDKRSNGIKDLRHARLVDEDWLSPHADDLLPPRTVVPPLPGVHYHVLVASVLKSVGSALADYFGDGLVGTGSARGTIFGDPALPLDIYVSTRTFAQQHHGTLLANEEVYQYLREQV
ncbi:esterase/lipase family protein [Hymenobacter guriensis]|uniref:Alpha/beta hydrolase n=1 Tax=Hymenobacter guriensis TaxID=2793065 RepID=A0ABS0L587_9BACT|nr:alpha/beta hydrolase [Hymenobacter guriensis]MBG8555310.1 alpha/beta hydrolase [Hymenobacter guriensis]